MKNCNICAVIPQIKPEFTLYDGDYWLANLRDTDQTLLATSFITAKRHVSEVDYLTVAEQEEFTVICNAVIRATRAAFEPITFNISCLKNDAFKEDPDNTPPEAAHVHWHIKPRYGTAPIEFAGDTFQDPAPGRYLADFERHRPSVQTAIAIADALRGNLSV